MQCQLAKVNWCRPSGAFDGKVSESLLLTEIFVRLRSPPLATRHTNKASAEPQLSE